MRAAPDWSVEGRDWPNREASAFPQHDGLVWHVQRMGAGPRLLLLHGAGAATHSWRDLVPLLAQHFEIMTLDLPGHGFTEAPPPQEMSLPRIAARVASLADSLSAPPDIIVGHSAGAAIALEMTRAGAAAPQRIIALNGAITPFGGAFAPVASALALACCNPFTERLMAWRAGLPGAVEQVVAGAGSRLDAAGVDHYRRLLRTRRHVAAALSMMAHWDLRPLVAALPEIEIPVLLVAGAGDRAVPPGQADAVAAHLVKGCVKRVEGGHLMHEERPAAFAALIQDACGAGA
ncbi:MAG: alpha/beta fold hydrolase [Alphaproteobacteria bacterium]|nr:alpha/beta fold hydrolase [Alphaproteobacteria bacterium]